MKHRIFIIIASLVMALGAFAQSDPLLSQYYETPTFYNPGAVGETDYLRIRAAGRMQWLGITNAPQSFMGMADMPFKVFEKRIGVGAVIEYESAGLYRTMNLGAQLGYKFRKLKGEFTVGVQIGMFDQSFKGSEVILPDEDDYHQGSDDAIPTQDVHGMAFDLGVGVWYANPRLRMGLSLSHALSPTVNLEMESAAGGSESSSDQKFQFRADRTLNFIACGNIQLKNTLFDIAPSVIFTSNFTYWTAEATLRARYNHLLWFGVGYRWDDAVTATIGIEVKDFYLGYSYDYSVSAIRRATSGSHEVVAGYRMKLDLSDKNKNRHKSIRIM